MKREFIAAALAVLFCASAANAQVGTAYAFDLRGPDHMMTWDADDPVGTLVDFDPVPVYATFAMDFNTAGTTLHVVDRGFADPPVRQMGTVDPTTGTFTAGALLGGDFDLAATETGLSVDPTDETFYLSSARTLYTVDPNTGIATTVGAFMLVGGGDIGLVIDIAIDNDGNMFAHSISTDSLYEVDKSSALCMLVGSHGLAANFAQGMDFDPTSNLLYAAIYTGGGTGSYGTWDTSTGVVTEITDLPSIPDPNADGVELELAIQKGETAGFVCPSEIDNGNNWDCYNVHRGMELEGSCSHFCGSDDVRARYNPGFVLNSEEAPVWLEFEGNAPTAIDIQVESQAGTPGLEYTVDAWNYNTNSYDELPPRQAESFNNDTVHTWAITPADHIENATGNVQCRVGWRKEGLTINFPWEVRVDQVGWNQ